ncbi:zinc-ribbon domain-containing protein [Massilia sp. Dwa41.01b]|uniref:zinc-ribbon domain-containing protein n=1 Tax=Massilia sp. Dwa41.01b TaxID=2709302 RepID=UPI0028048093|nr:zinc-ribbon domain-containing protein [Massilia sp. Dwa41.01b]
MFRVASDQLKLRGGIVRCGACQEIFDGSASLVDLDKLAARAPAAPTPAAPTPAAPEPAPAAAPPPFPTLLSHRRLPKRTRCPSPSSNTRLTVRLHRRPRPGRLTTTCRSTRSTSITPSIRSASCRTSRDRMRRSSLRQSRTRNRPGLILSPRWRNRRHTTHRTARHPMRAP